MNRLLFIVAAVIVAGALIGGFWAVGGPQQARFEKLDRKRLSNMHRVGSDARCEPESVEGIDARGCVLLPGGLVWRDPVTDAPYTRRIRDDGLLEVCGELQSKPANIRALSNRTIQLDGQTACIRFRLDKEGRWREAR